MQSADVGSNTRSGPTWSVASLGVIVMWLAVLLGLVNHYGLIGVSIGLIFASCTGYFLSRSSYRLIPFRKVVWSNRDLASAVAISMAIGLLLNQVDAYPKGEGLYFLGMLLFVWIGYSRWVTQGRLSTVLMSVFSCIVLILFLVGWFWSEALLDAVISSTAIILVIKGLERRRRKMQQWVANLSGPNVCPTCGRSLSTTSRICPRCETRLS